MIEIPYAQLATLHLSESDLSDLLSAAMGIDFSDNVTVTGAPDGEYDYDDPVKYPPQLTPATMDLSSMVAVLEALANAVHGQQLQTLSGRLDDATQERKEYNDDMLEALRTGNAERLKMQETQSKKHRIEIIKAAFSVFAGSLLLVASIVATPLTGGAAAVVTAAAAVGLVMAVLDLANACCANAGIEATNADGSKRAMDVSIAGGITAATELLRSNGKLQFLSDEQVKKWEMGWGTATTLTVVLAMLAAGGKGASSLNNLAKAASAGDAQALAQLEGYSVKFESFVRVSDAVAQLGDTSAGIVDGRLSLLQGEQQYVVSTAMAEKDFYTAMAEVSSNQSKTLADAITQSIKNLDENRNSVLRLLQLMTQTPTAHTFM